MLLANFVTLGQRFYLYQYRPGGGLGPLRPA